LHYKVDGVPSFGDGGLRGSVTSRVDRRLGYTMRDPKERRPLEEYLEEIQDVHELLKRHDETSMLEYWAFIVWGVLVLAGTAGHWLLATRGAAGAVNPLVIWGPVVVLGGLAEVAAWLTRVSRESTPLLTRRFVRFMLSAVGVVVVVAGVGLRLLSMEMLSPGLLLLLVALVFLVYAEITYSVLFVEAYALLAAGFVMFAFHPAGVGSYVAVGMLTGTAFLVLGVHAWALERRKCV
jgi:hypothetical protein